MKRMITENPFLLLTPLILLTIAAFYPTASSLVQIWTDHDIRTYSHGLLLLLVSIYYIFSIWKKHKIVLRLRPSFIGIGCTLGFSLAWFIAWIGSIQIIQFLALILIITSLFVSIMGIDQTRLFLFPLVICIFAIPVWDFMGTPLRAIAAESVGVLLNAVNILSVVEDYKIHIPAGTFFVDAGCGGLGQFMAALSIGIIYVYMQPMHWVIRILLIVFAAITAIVTNIVRIFVVVVCGNLTNMQHYFVTVEHVSLGWGVFAIGITIYFFLANRIVIKLSKKLAYTCPPMLNELSSGEFLHLSNFKLLILLLVTLFAVSSGPLMAHIYREPQKINKTVYSEMPENMTGWNRDKTGSKYSRLDPEITGADIQSQYKYINFENNTVELYIYNYFWQQQGKEAINSLHKVYQNNLWKPLYKKSQAINLADGAFDVEATEVESLNGKIMLVWKWYNVNNVWTGNELKARILNIWGTLNRKPEMTVIVIATEVNDSEESASAILKGFASAARKIKYETAGVNK